MERKPVTVFLKVVGVLFVVFGVISMISISSPLELISFGGIYALSGVLGIIIAVLDFVAGMVILMFLDEEDKAGMLAIFSICMLAAVAVNVVVALLIYAQPENDIFWVWSPFVSLVLPVLFLLGAMRNRREMA